MRKKVLVAWFSKSVWSVRKESNMSWTVVGFQSPEERQVFRILRSLSCRFGWGDCWKCHWSKLVAASWFRCIRKSQKAMNPNKATCHKADGPHKVDNDNIMTHWQPPKIVAANFAAIKPAHNIRKKKTITWPLQKNLIKVVIVFAASKSNWSWWNKSWLAVNWQKNAPPFWWTKVVCFAGIMLHNSTRELLESPPSPLQSPRGSPRFAQTLPRNFGAAPGTPLPSTGGGWKCRFVHGEVCTRHALLFGRNPKQKISGFIYNMLFCVCFFCEFFMNKKQLAHPSMHNNA